MTLAMFKVILAIIILLVAVIGGLWPFYRKAQHIAGNVLAEFELPVGESVASGIFLGAGLLHMLPDAAQDFNKAGYNFPFPFLIAGISFLLLLLLEHISVSLKHRATHLLSSIALLSVTMLSVHSLLEGAAVGLAASFATTLIIFIAIIAHKGAASFALSINLNRSQLSLTNRIIAFSVFAFMTPIGIFGGDWLLATNQHDTLLTPIFSSLAAGTFLYIGTLHGLERASLIRHCCSIKEFFFMLTGFILMAIVAIWT
jgi:solute carrier family 39 (zinc transporter), member 1/2/3